MKKKFMQIAIKEAHMAIRRNDGGPFGAVIVRKGKQVAKAHNEVIGSNDPTSHAEILAIRRASRKLRRFNLSDCEIYTTCEPCPMCLGAILWARIPRVYFGCRKEDTVRIGFDDKAFYDVMRDAIRGKYSKSSLKTIEIGRKQCLELFKIWAEKKDKILY